MMKATKSPSPSSEPSVAIVLVALIGPLTLWALHFSVLYGAHHLLCATLAGSRAADVLPATVSGATVAALFGLLLMIVRPEVVLRMTANEAVSSHSRLLLTGVMRVLALLCCFGVLWAGSAAFLLPACASLA
ncbi:MAG: hypothetical protein ACU83V_12505 [Gammaproteobacteria bacterium]